MATVKQLKAIKLVTEKNLSVSKAMKQAGYKVTKNPHELTRSKAWGELMEKHGIDEISVTKRHGELLRSKKEEIATKAVDLAYKVQGKYDQKRTPQSTTPVLIQINVPNDPQQVTDTA